MSNAKLHMLKENAANAEQGACGRERLKHTAPRALFTWFAAKYPAQACAACLALTQAIPGEGTSDAPVE